MLEKNAVVSVIMNCHNGEEFLKYSVQSIINQSFTDWELIFFDNVSSDRSLEIVKSFNDQRIKVFRSQKFLNLYHARNEALKKISGRFICFLDTDDFWENDKLEQQKIEQQKLEQQELEQQELEQQELDKLNLEKQK